MQASMYQTGKHNAHTSMDFEQRVQPLRQRIYNLAYRNLRNIDDAEDVTQETLARAWSHYARFDNSRSLEAWLMRIAVNLCIDTARRRHRRRTLSLDTMQAGAPESEPEGYQVADSTQDPATRLMAAQVDDTLLRALHTLPASYRRCVQLLQQQHSYKEIGALMGCPVGTIRSRVHRARVLICKQLETRRTS